MIERFSSLLQTAMSTTKRRAGNSRSPPPSPIEPQRKRHQRASWQQKFHCRIRREISNLRKNDREHCYTNNTSTVTPVAATASSPCPTRVIR